MFLFHLGSNTQYIKSEIYQQNYNYSTPYVCEEFSQTIIDILYVHGERTKILALF